VPATEYYIHKASSNRQIVGARSLPVNGDVKAAKERLTTIKMYPLNSTPNWTEPKWLDVSGRSQDTTPCNGKTTSSSGKSCTRPSMRSPLRMAD
jgi:hypothetical protein